MGRVSLRFTSYRVRPLDPDNYIGGLKQIIDGLRFSGLIRNDDPESVTIEAAQVKVSSFAEQKTEIEIVWPGN